jgi:hypothetical protein
VSGVKHTPGPWKAIGRFVWAGDLAATGNEQRIAAADQTPDSCDPTPIRNATLMAAAPELAQACKAVLRMVEEQTEATSPADLSRLMAARVHAVELQLRAALQKAGLR